MCIRDSSTTDPIHGDGDGSAGPGLADDSRTPTAMAALGGSTTTTTTTTTTWSKYASTDSWTGTGTGTTKSTAAVVDVKDVISCPRDQLHELVVGYHDIMNAGAVALVAKKLALGRDTYFPSPEDEAPKYAARRHRVDGGEKNHRRGPHKSVPLLLDAIVRVSPNMHPTQCAKTMWGLMRMSSKGVFMPRRVAEALNAQLENMAPRMDGWAAGTALMASAKLAGSRLSAHVSARLPTVHTPHLLVRYFHSSS